MLDIHEQFVPQGGALAITVSQNIYSPLFKYEQVNSDVLSGKPVLQNCCKTSVKCFLPQGGAVAIALSHNESPFPEIFEN